MKKTLLLLSTLIPLTAISVEVPHTFTDGSPAYASEINDNFEAVSNGVNTNDARIANIENPTPIKVKQMFCWHLRNQGYGVGDLKDFILGNNEQYPEFNLLNCYIPEQSNEQHQYSSADVFSNGWKLSAINFGGSGMYLFEK